MHARVSTVLLRSGGRLLIGLLVCGQFVSARADTPQIVNCDGYWINGFNDFYGQMPPDNSAFNETAISEPSETILLGEKLNQSNQYIMDILNPPDVLEVEQSRHDGTANHAFADGSVRSLRRGQCFTPRNLWAVTSEGRTQPINF